MRIDNSREQDHARLMRAVPREAKATSIIGGAAGPLQFLAEKRGVAIQPALRIDTAMRLDAKATLRDFLRAHGLGSTVDHVSVTIPKLSQYLSERGLPQELQMDSIGEIMAEANRRSGGRVVTDRHRHIGVAVTTRDPDTWVVDRLKAGIAAFGQSMAERIGIAKHPIQEAMSRGDWFAVTQMSQRLTSFQVWQLLPLARSATSPLAMRSLLRGHDDVRTAYAVDAARRGDLQRLAVGFELDDPLRDQCRIAASGAGQSHIVGWLTKETVSAVDLTPQMKQSLLAKYLRWTGHIGADGSIKLTEAGIAQYLARQHPEWTAQARARTARAVLETVPQTVVIEPERRRLGGEEQLDYFDQYTNARKQLEQRGYGRSMGSKGIAVDVLRAFSKGGYQIISTAHLNQYLARHPEDFAKMVIGGLKAADIVDLYLKRHVERGGGIMPVMDAHANVKDYGAYITTDSVARKFAHIALEGGTR